MDDQNSEIKVEKYILEEQNISRKPGERKRHDNKLAIILMPMLIVLVAIVFYNIGASKFKPEGTVEREEQLSKLHEVIQMVEENYVDSVDAANLYESSINGMLNKLDPHSAFIPAKDVEASNEQLAGHFGGVGIRFIILRDTLMITNVIPGGPSYMAGLKSGDRIVQVDHDTIASVNLKISDVHDKLKGSFGSEVLLTVKRLGEEGLIEFPIVRGDIPLPSLSASYRIKDDIGLIRLSSFSNYTDSEFNDAIIKLKSEGVQKLILDLRHNGGGYMHTAISVADQFLVDGDLIVYTKGVHLDKNETFATSFGQCENMSVAVLVNSGSASASEILSGALQDQDRAIVIGRRTFGKGLVQRPMNLSDGSELRLTVSRYYTPSGRSIQKPYGHGIDYEADIMERYENGELQEIDSSIFEKAEKFKTLRKGKVVYGGGGIMPDIFVPIDTSGASFYLTSLNYSEAYRNFCFDYMDRHRAELTAKYNDDIAFNAGFDISEDLLNEFLDYASETENITRNEQDLKHSKYRIKNYLKAELATYLYQSSSRFLISIPFDKDVQVAIGELDK